MSLSDEWTRLLKILSSEDKDPLDNEIIVSDIRPILVWKNKEQIKAKFCRAIEDKLKGNITVKGVQEENETFRFKFTNNQWVKLKQLAKDICNQDSHSWQEKFEKYLQIDKQPAQPTYDLSKKRIFVPSNEEQTLKKQKSSQHSVLLRIDGTTTENGANHFVEKILKDGQGICLNNSEEICVLDNGKGICVYDEHLTILENAMMPPALINNDGTSLFFNTNSNIFLFYVPTFQILYLCRKDGENVFEARYVEDISNVVSIRTYTELPYVLSSNKLTVRIDKHSILSFCQTPDVAFSDFIIIEGTAFILDSLNGVIYKYFLREGSLEKVKINPETTLENPQGICSYVDNMILVSQADKQVITQFKFTSNNDLEFIREFSTKDYQPNKLISKNNFIYATTFKQTPAKIQSDVSGNVNSNLTLDEDNQFGVNQLDMKNQVWESFMGLIQSIDASQPGRDSNFTQQIFKFLKKSLSSNILTSHLLNHLSDTTRKLLMEFVDFVDKLPENQIHSIKRFTIFDVFGFLINFRFIYHNYNFNTHFGVFLSPRKTNSNGLIVFIDKNLKFSFTPSDEVFTDYTVGVIWAADNSDETDESLISIFGSTLVQVFLPSNQTTIDERGMFVVISSDSSREAEGVGEIISFGELITRKANSYHLVGVCNFDKLSLVLYSDHMSKERISFPIDENVKDPICFVSITLFSMSDSLLEMFVTQMASNLKSSQEVIPPLKLVTPKPLLHL